MASIYPTITAIKPCAGDQLDFTTFKLAGADFRATQIRQYGNGQTNAGSLLADQPVTIKVKLMVTMGHVQAEYIDTSADQLFDDFCRCRSRPDGGHDFGSAFL